MVRGLQRCLALRAVVAHGLEGGLVAFAADDLTVLHVHPHAAFHLAAAAARGTNALDLAGRRGAGAGFGQRGAGACDSDRSSGSGSHLRERATRHRELAHASSFLVARLRGAPSPLAVCGLSSEPLAAPLVGRGVSPAADFELPPACLASACVQRVRRWLRYGGKRAARIRPVAWLRAEWRNHVSSMMALTWEDIG